MTRLSGAATNPLSAPPSTSANATSKILNAPSSNNNKIQFTPGVRKVSKIINAPRANNQPMVTAINKQLSSTSPQRLSSTTGGGGQQNRQSSMNEKTTSATTGLNQPLF